MQIENNNTSITTLPPAQRAAVVLKSDVAEKELRAMIERTSAITNVVDMNGRKEAHAAGMSIKNARVAIEKAGKEAREDATAFSKAVIAESARLAAITEEEEARLFGLRDAYDAQMAAEKAEKERIEAERKATIMAKISDITSLPVKYASANSTILHGVLADLANIEIIEHTFQEFTDEAKTAVDTTAHALLTMRTAAQQREAEEAERQRLAELARQQAEADRLELQRLREKQAEEDRVRAEEAARVERERAAERQAAAAAQAEADRIAAQKLAEEKAAKEALERQLAEMQAKFQAAEEEKRAAAQLERDHAEALEMNAAWKPAADPVAVEQAAAVLETELEVQTEVVIEDAPSRPTDVDIASAVASHFNVPLLDAARWLTEIDHAALIGDLT